jgi:hypothetical protein
MKTIIALTSLLAAAGVGLDAGPLNRRHVAGDARWVLHLDAEALRATEVGRQFMAKALEPHTASAKAQLRSAFEFDLDWSKLRSITAYGPSFLGRDDPNGVLVVETSMAVEAALEGALTKEPPVLRIGKLDSTTSPMYSIGDQGYVSLAPGGVIIAGRNLATVEKGRAVVDGGTPSLASGGALSGYSDSGGAVFFLALAEGFAQHAPLPPNAAMLKNAEGIRVAISEREGAVRLELSIRMNSAEVAAQVQQVAQGLVALAVLGGGQNPELQALAQKVRIAVEDNTLNVSAAVPIDDVVQKLGTGKL